MNRVMTAAEEWRASMRVGAREFAKATLKLDEAVLDWLTYQGRG